MAADGGEVNPKSLRRQMLSGLIGNLGDERCCFFPLANLMLMLLTMGKEIFCLALWLLGDFFLVLIAVAIGVFVFLYGVFLGIGGEVGHEVSEILQGQVESHRGHGGNGWGEAGDVAAVELGFLEEAEVVAALEQRPSHLDVILTGPSIPSALLAMADQVTQLRRCF